MTLFSRKTLCSVKLQSFVNLTLQGKYDRSSGRTDRFKNFTNYINIGKFGIIFWWVMFGEIARSQRCGLRAILLK